MKTIFTLFILLLCILPIFSQTPSWQWTNHYGGTLSDVGISNTVDSAGNIYTIGNFKDSVNFGTTLLTSSGDNDIFIVKLSSDGEFFWVQKAGGTHADDVYSISVDNNGNSYIAGSFVGTAYFGPLALTSCSLNGDMYIAKLNSDGEFLWAVRAGDVYWDHIYSIKIDNSGNIYLTGDFKGSITFDSTSISSLGESDIFIAKFNQNGVCLWARRTGGVLDDRGISIALDNEGYGFVAGYFQGSVSFGSTILTCSINNIDVFVAKFDQEGNWVWATQASGGALYLSTKGIVLDSSGFLYIAGNFTDSVTIDNFPLINSGNYNIYVACITPQGNWDWVSQSFGQGSGYCQSIAIYNSDITIVGSVSGGVDFGSTSLVSNGNFIHTFLAGISQNGNWIWAIQASGTTNSRANSVATDTNGSIIVTGYFQETADFGSTNLISNGAMDIFISKVTYSVSIYDEVNTTAVIQINNYPNPFYNTTSINCYSAKDVACQIAIYNNKGQLIKMMKNGYLKKGLYTFVWDGTDDSGDSVTNGIYFLQTKSELYQSVKKMTLLK